MLVEFLSKFSKDLDNLKQKSVKSNIEKVIKQFELADSVDDIPSIKKLTGFKNAYRIRIGDYRIGVFIENNKVEFARVVHRKDIYKYFP